MTEQGKTLGQLNVQPGDVVRCVNDGGRSWWTVGKEYHVYESEDGLIIKDDDDARWLNTSALFTIVSRNEVNPSQDGASMITKEQALELLSSIADNPPRVCVAWCGKAEDDCACFKANVAREAVNGQAEDALQTAIALHERVERLEAALRKLHHAVCGETGFAACVRLDSGKAYPWPALDEADEAARAALKGADHE